MLSWFRKRRAENGLLGRVVIEVDCRGCMAQDHRISRIGEIEAIKTHHEIWGSDPSRYENQLIWKRSTDANSWRSSPHDCAVDPTEFCADPAACASGCKRAVAQYRQEPRHLYAVCKVVQSRSDLDDEYFYPCLEDGSFQKIPSGRGYFWYR